MTAFNIILRDLAFIFLFALGEIVLRKDLLQQRVTLVFFVGENAFHDISAPCFLSAGRWDVVRCELFRYSVRSSAAEKQLIYLTNDRRLFLVHHKTSVLAAVVAQKPLERDCKFAVRETLSLSPLAVFGDRAAFLLCDTSHYGKQHFPASVKCVDIFLLEKAFHPVLL